MRPQREDDSLRHRPRACAGFGSLALSGYEGVASMGRLCIFALGWVLFASLFVTPAIMYLAWRKRRDDT